MPLKTRLALTSTSRERTESNAITSISSPMIHIFDVSLSSGVVPEKLKIPRVVPLFKIGDKSLFSNYRPISVLPSFYKVLEKLVYNRNIDYMGKCKILTDNQFGFRKQHSTEYTSAALLYHKISAYLLQLYVPCTIVLFIPTYFFALWYGALLIHPP